MVHSHTAPGQAFKKHFKASSSTWQPFIAWHQKSSLSFLVKILRKGKEFWTKNLSTDEAQTVPKRLCLQKKLLNEKRRKELERVSWIGIRFCWVMMSMIKARPGLGSYSKAQDKKLGFYHVQVALTTRAFRTLKSPSSYNLKVWLHSLGISKAQKNEI